MKKQFIVMAFVVLFLSISGLAYATNGDNLIGVGPTSRAMGGVGIAAPQDSISSIFNNPAAMGTGSTPYEFDFSATLFVPTVNAKVTMPAMFGGNWTKKSQDDAFAIPAIGLTAPIGKDTSFGIAAYGVSGLGVDYRNFDPMNMNTKVSVMKFTPAISHKMGNFSVGLGVDVDYQAADFGSGQAHGYALGARLGVLYNIGIVSLGATYVTPQSVTHERVYDFDNNGTIDDLKLEIPQQIGFGIAVKPMPNLLIEFDPKWINWADAKGYKDFDWENQWVFGLGVQYKATPNLALRVGYNYGKNPVKTHDGFNPMGTTNVQGVNMNTFGYEYFRIIGFPAIVEQHLTFGVGYDFTPKFGINIGYKNAFSKTISESTTIAPITLESNLKEQAFDIGLTYRF